MSETDMFEWLESSSLAVYVRHSHLLYPVIEIIHISGFVLLVGSAFLFDFRLLGVSKRIPVTDLARHVLPWSRRGLFLAVPSGFVLFMTQATSLAHNSIFWIKLSLIGLAVVNALCFHRFTFKGVTDWNSLAPTPAMARMAGIASLILWTSVISCGRFLAYLE